MKKPTATNDNPIPDAAIEHHLSLCDWVRPVAAAMRAVAIPEPVLQKAMGYLLEELDKELDN